MTDGAWERWTAGFGVPALLSPVFAAASEPGHSNLPVPAAGSPVRTTPGRWAILPVDRKRMPKLSADARRTGSTLDFQSSRAQNRIVAETEDAQISDRDRSGTNGWSRVARHAFKTSPRSVHDSTGNVRPRSDRLIAIGHTPRSPSDEGKSTFT
jgi:hypothetical protein